MKTILRFMVPLLVLSVSVVAWAHGGEIHELVQTTADIYKGVTVLVNGNDAGEQGFIYEDRTYLPVRAIAESLGASVEYDEAEKTVRLQAGRQTADDPVTLVVTGHKLSEIREATAKYMDIAQAREDGFKQASGMIPNHGYHFMNTLNVLSSLNLEKPSGLVYIHDERGEWQLAAVEYTAILKPSEPLLPGGQWVKHEAACHYEDGNELTESNPFACPDRHPRTSSAYASWHPSAWTFHVWAYYPNPYGLYAAENPLLVPYNIPGVDIEHHHKD